MLNNSVFSVKEQLMIESACRKDDSDRKLAALLSMYMGLRISEICSLRWSDYNAQDKTLHIQRRVERTKNSIHASNESKTKLEIIELGEDSYNRIIPVPSKMLKYFKENEGRHSYVFSGGVNGILDPRVLQKYYRKLLNDNRIRYIHFNALRDTFTVRCAENGMDLVSLCEILGHKTINHTWDKIKNYITVSTSHKRKCMEQMCSNISRIKC